MWETVLSLALMALILVGCAVVTNWFTRTMYNRCPECAALNAKRRSHCRSCGHDFGGGA